ncbi:TetR/AcrR family transcriptional regulator [Roseateles violae]|uniref:TetR/AcrR family transcriptional regulator n=1 Tax=Roseateles violae TaxID=3058042 RepID=A0ABT8DYY0_9BURK|nr:TetR/AcrR family transcriptional regulator [Pelomonas sp. PFR6]MDN3922782.1 TetR/AcrR family transcriptional regulator [Pelomonas sp. PFR6]
MSSQASPSESSLALIAAAFPGPRGAAKREVLSQALLCFNELGIEACTIDELRRRSGQSVGTIYHHFKNKEGVVAALFFVGLDEQSRAIAAAVEAAADSTPRMVAALIGAYLQWAEDTPEMARFVLLAREAVAKGPGGALLAEKLQQRYRPLDERLEAAMAGGEALRLPVELIPALILGPAESYCRAWLAGRRQTAPGRHAKALAAAAWRSIAA